MSKLVSIILPCYNELGNVIPLIHAIREILSEQNHEVIVVDDNSPDGTYDAVVNLHLPNVKAILRTNNPSFALSIREGIEASMGEIVIIMDSDFNHQPIYLPIMITNCLYYDVVSGSRFVYGGKMDSRFRHICSWLFNILLRMMTRTFITDSLFGFIAIKRDALYQINFDKVFWGYGDYCIRLMYYIQKNEFTVLQIPSILGHRKYGEGNKKLFKTLLKYLFATVKLTLDAKKD